MLHPNAKVHHDRNSRTQFDWQTFQSHRACVMEVLSGLRRSFAPPASLMLLGVGNGNDVDLQQLAEDYSKVILVDLDPIAVQRAIERVPLEARQRFEIAAPMDVTGIIDRLPTDHDTTITDAQWMEIIQSAKSPELGLPLADHVVSTCLLSQVVDSASFSIAPNHPRYFELLLAIRDGHLQSLARLAKPSGLFTLITDFVSSETLPQMRDIDQADLEPLLIHAVNNRNFFTGMNPAVLQQKISAANNPLVESSVSHGIWRWKMGPKCFAVTAMTARRSSNKA